MVSSAVVRALRAAGGSANPPARSAEITRGANSRTKRCTARKAYPLDGFTCPPAVPMRTIRGLGHASKGSVVIGITPLSCEIVWNTAPGRRCASHVSIAASYTSSGSGRSVKKVLSMSAVCASKGNT